MEAIEKYNNGDLTTAALLVSMMSNEQQIACIDALIEAENYDGYTFLFLEVPTFNHKIELEIK